PTIQAFEERDRENPPARDGVLFIGSSSIRRWDLKKSFPDLPAVKRGFGGSELSDSLRYFDRIVFPYRPRAILLYAGENDINNGETAEQVIADYESFAARVRSRLPDTHFAFLAIKPSPVRRDHWPEGSRANQAVRKLAEQDPNLHYLDTATPLLGTDNQPNPDLFHEDELHLSEAGYQIWNNLVRTWLDSL
ncbi:MAG: hypothetical protein GWO24_06505, partial [Akkermansiaceae bacterium]|nr:hypothetical protein [Akkermansiaceae bacterium]